MKKKRILSLLLCLSLFCTLIVPASTAYAEPPSGSGMQVSKTATRNDDGTYTITLEAYATGSQVTSTITEDIPTDIILVLDQSGSMADKMSQFDFRPYTGKSNNDYFYLRHNGAVNPNLYHKLEDGKYATVSVTKTTTYRELNNLPNYKRNSECYWKYRDNLYEMVDDEYKKVELDSKYVLFVGDRYTYTFADGTTVVSDGDSTKPNFGIHGPLYTPNADGNSTVYTYTYTDKDGVMQTIGTSTGRNTKPTNFTLYERYQGVGTTTRLQALKDAVAGFVDSVEQKAAGPDGKLGTEDDINHRVAVVGFASKSGNGNNTELLSIRGTNSGSVGVAYNSISNQNLKDVLQSMDTADGQYMVGAAITALAANGATRTDLGMDMAQRILTANPVPNGEKRNRVVIVFTDGSPTDSNGFELGVADAAISKANAIKNSGATVYSIGIFEGADANSAGTKPTEDYSDSGFFGPNYTTAQMSAACNWFMQNLSSNNGTVRYPSYYLSASDSDSLNSIFQQISQQIQEGGSATTLGASAVVKDVISPYFQLPKGATANDITLKTYAYGAGGTWTENAGAMGAQATVKPNGELEVTGFDFSENWCGTETDANGNVTYRGNKLVISFTVQPKEGFLGGNEVPTNSNAGVYEDSSATEPKFVFPVPTVDVPIQDVTVAAEDKNVYLLDGVTAEQLKTGATVMVGDIELDLNEPNYGLQDWQTAFVDITVTVKDKDGNTISPDGLKDLTADTTYTIEVTVAPKMGVQTGAKTGKNDPAAKINVFKPELTFKDSEGYYGADVPELSGNLTKTEWKHGTTLDTAVTMIGAKPELGFTYTPEAGKIDNNKINTKQDIGVDVAVKIGNADVTNQTTFLHTACAGQTCTLPENMEFLIHVKTCTLTIKKTGGAGNESYVFDVLKDGTKYSEVTIWGNGTEELVELPVGKYTIQENTGWSWRYSANNGGSAELTAQNPTGSITCTNTANDKIYWLNGFSQVVRNIFGVSH